MSTNTESLVINLDVRSRDLETRLEQVDRQLNNVESTSSSLASSFGMISAAAGAVVIGLGAMVKSSAELVNEQKVLADRCGLTIDQFNNLTVATKQYGLEAQDVADIAQDLSDRLGEFKTSLETTGTATGAFTDVQMALHLTNEEALQLNETLSSMDVSDQMKTLKNLFDDANLSMQDQTFVLESLSSNLSRLMPLYANNAKELDELTAKQKKYNESLGLVGEETEGLQKANVELDILGSTTSKATVKISAAIASTDVWSKSIELLNNGIVNLANNVSNFIKDTKTSNVTNQILDMRDMIKDLQGIEKTGGTIYDSMGFPENFTAEGATKKIKELRAQIADLGGLNKKVAKSAKADGEVSKNLQRKSEQAQIIVKTAQDNLLSAQEKLTKEYEKNRKILQNSGGSDKDLAILKESYQKSLNELKTSSVSAAKVVDDSQKKLAERIAANAEDAGKTRKEILTEQYEEQKALLEEYSIDTAKLTLQYQLAITEIEKKGAEERKRQLEEEYKHKEDLIKQGEEIAAKAASARKKEDRERIMATKNYTTAVAALNNSIFENKKAVAKGVVVVNTAQGISEALKIKNPILMASQIAKVSAIGIKQYSNIESAKVGGGTISGGSTGDSSSSAPSANEQEQGASINATQYDANNDKYTTLKVETTNDSDTAKLIQSLTKTATIDGTL